LWLCRYHWITSKIERIFTRRLVRLIVHTSFFATMLMHTIGPVPHVVSIGGALSLAVMVEALVPLPCAHERKRARAEEQ
jgi:hypothetical protein